MVRTKPPATAAMRGHLRLDEPDLVAALNVAFPVASGIPRTLLAPGRGGGPGEKRARGRRGKGTESNGTVPRGPYTREVG